MKVLNEFMASLSAGDAFEATSSDHHCLILHASEPT
jgi:hypothetical protein